MTGVSCVRFTRLERVRQIGVIIICKRFVRFDIGRRFNFAAHVRTCVLDEIAQILKFFAAATNQQQ